MRYGGVRLTQRPGDRQRSPWASRPGRTAALGRLGDLVEQGGHSPADLIPYRADGGQVETRGVGQVPVEVSTARLLKALADPTRLRLVSMVAAHEGQEACVCELTEPLELTQPTISHHLKILVDAGIFTRDKRGVWAYYALVPAALDALSAVLKATS